MFSSPARPAVSRRDFLGAVLLSPLLLQPAAPDARWVADVPLGDPGGAAPPPFGRLLGDGLDARLFTDLSRLGDPRSAVKPQSAIRTATDSFFIRTAAPPNLPPAEAWTIRIGGLVQAPVDVRLRDLEAHAAAPSRVLLECSGNADQTNYGLLSAADWEGIPVGAVLDRARATTASALVLVSGIDDDSRAWRTSIAGASWIFTRDELARAVIALRMNGEPLPRHHGAPARLLVPGWYGCACIKWVNRIELVPDDSAATSQMLEFSARTHQPFDSRDIERSLRTTDPLLRARDFIPASIDTAAMPVRVEKWIVGGRLEYRLTGIVWGGARPTNALSIRFRSGAPWTRVDNCPLPESTLTWSLWTHTWRPAEPGRYQIVLRVDDTSIRTRRLDVFFYVREIQIDEV